MAVCALAGCDSSRQYQSSGFSGIGSEAQIVTRSDSRLALGSGTLHADIPVHYARSGSKSGYDQAEAAMRKGGGTAARAKKTRVGHQDLAISVVYVNDKPFAVVKPAPGIWVKAITPHTQQALRSDAKALTGCASGGGVYGDGPRNKQLFIALAMPLACG